MVLQVVKPLLWEPVNFVKQVITVRVAIEPKLPVQLVMFVQKEQNLPHSIHAQFLLIDQLLEPHHTLIVHHVQVSD